MANSVKLKRGNKVLHVNESRVKSFLKQGYDQINNKGKVVEKATGGRIIQLPEHNKALDKIDALEAEVTKLKGDVTKAQNANKEVETAKPAKK